MFDPSDIARYGRFLMLCYCHYFLSPPSPHSCSYHYECVWWCTVTVAEMLTIISIWTRLADRKKVTQYNFHIFKASACTEVAKQCISISKQHTVFHIRDNVAKLVD